MYQIYRYKFVTEFQFVTLASQISWQSKMRHPLQIYNGFVTNKIRYKFSNRIFRYKYCNHFVTDMSLQIVTNALQII